MGLLSKILTGGIGDFFADKIEDKLKDKQKQGIENLQKASRFVGAAGGPSIGGDKGGFLSKVIGESKAGEGFSKVLESIDEKTGLVGKNVEAWREKAMGGTDIRERVMGQIDKITGQELPEVGEYKPAGKVAEWMNRLGAGLYAAGGGNPEDIYRNFRNKEMAKQERYDKQVALRESALAERNQEVLGALGQIDMATTQTASGIAAQETEGLFGLQGKAIDVAEQVAQNEFTQTQNLLEIQVSYDQLRMQHQNRLAEMDKQGSMNERQLRLGAEIQVTNEVNAKLNSYGLNPASFQGAVSALATGNFDNLDPMQSHQLALYSQLEKATTDEEARNYKLQAVTNLVGTRIHARSNITGEHLWVEGQPVYTTVGNASQAATALFGSEEDAAKAFTLGHIPSESEAITSMLEDAGYVSASPEHELGESSGLETMNQGFPSTADAIGNQFEANPADAETQKANAAEIWNRAAQAMQTGQADLHQVLTAMQAQGAQPEIMQMIVQESLNMDYWNGRDKQAEINAILMGLPSATQMD